MNRIMSISILAGILITAGAILLVLGTIPMKNSIDGNTLTVKYIIGKEKIDISNAHFYPVPDAVNHNIIRIGGTSLGKKHSGTRTRTRYKFYLTGEGERKYFEIGDKKYLVDGI